jgi:hypothetical protein
MAEVNVDPSATVLWSLLLEEVVVTPREGVRTMTNSRAMRMMYRCLLRLPPGARLVSAGRKFVVNASSRSREGVMNFGMVTAD